MAYGRDDDPAARSGGRAVARRGAHAGSAARIDGRLLEQLCQLGREVVREPVPQHLIDIVRATKAHGRRAQPSCGRDEAEPPL